MNTTISFPGFAAPVAGFDAPFDMLEACHERVLRSLDLLERLVAHIDAHGHDAASRSAAKDVLRYFDRAAPQHHEDEERHVFPALLALGDARLREVVQQLQAEHRRFNEAWPRLRARLEDWVHAPTPAPLDADARADAAAFIAMNRAHVALEEQAAYPAAKPLFSDAELARMGAEMQDRRRG
ncbi:hemerythrin domain-containing protein [Tibeticola sp.]|jgi:hemerythrin-like domain-containing protein|uniref:hemerythrin domain-containing protein n=1 Tax=Tibeticola sp. TaxID=2005368 RepID=UPI00258281B1|nr:hemerythrin domain-containing protein [Tibeticola sp.]MCI4441835.1 hemerythrin domain-containing protein [Tibeticola sp.]